MGRKTYEDLFFPFMRLCSKSPSYNRTVSIAAVFLIAAAIIIATHGQKSLH